MNTLWKLKSFDRLTAEELYGILRLRSEVFVVEQNCPYLDCDGADQVALHLWAEVEGEVAAYCRLFDQGIKYPDAASIGRVVTSSKQRRTGLGKPLMSLAIEAVNTRFHNPDIRISAQNYILGFYRDLGFETVGESYLEDEIPHTEMIRKA